LRRDTLLFARDPTQWGQLFILAALVIIYLANIRYMPTEIAPFRIAVAYWNLATLGLIVASVAGRFAFTAVGAEGAAFFASRALPFGAGPYVWAKFLFTAVPLTLLAGGTLFFSNRFLGVEGAALFYMLFVAVCSSLALSALALAAGCVAPVFDSRNPAKAVMSPWGLVYMVVAMGYVASLLATSARPVYRYYTSLLSGGPPPDYLRPALIVGLGSLAVLLLSLAFAWERLRRLEPGS
jgi:ABC-2 type transport system permease protein